MTAQVALLFLVNDERGIAHEAAWRAWFSSAEGLVPAAALQDSQRLPNLGRCAKILANSRGNPLARQFLFSAYVHSTPGSPHYGRMHTFYQRELPVRHQVRGGKGAPAVTTGQRAAPQY